MTSQEIVQRLSITFAKFIFCLFRQLSQSFLRGAERAFPVLLIGQFLEQQSGEGILFALGQLRSLSEGFLQQVSHIDLMLTLGTACGKMAGCALAGGER